MADKKISRFTYTSKITGDELIGVAINGENKAISVGQILNNAENSYMNQCRDQQISQMSHDIIKNEIIAREANDKVKTVSNVINDLYTEVGNLNDKLDNTVDDVFNKLTSYTDHIQKNSDLIAYIHSDAIRLDKAMSITCARVMKNTEGINQHTQDIINVHDGLVELTNEVHHNVYKLNNNLSYLSDSVYPIVDDSHSKLDTLIEKLNNLENVVIPELSAKIDNLINKE